jgi:carbonic anhydrase
MPEHLLHGYTQFRREYFAGERDYLLKLAREGQNPSVLYIGCSDSRVIPELLTSAQPGQIFVVRNVANLAPELDHPDASVGACVEYAVDVLRVEHVVVCGHYGCGGIRALLDGIDRVKHLPSLHEWLRSAEAPVERARASGLTGDDLFRRAVEENVLYQMRNLVTFGPVKEALAGARLQLHGWIYDLGAATLSVWDVDGDAFVPAESLISKTAFK